MEVNIKNCKKGRKLGEGAFSMVFRWTLKKDVEDQPKSIAVKEVDRNVVGSYRERELLARLTHENIVRFLGACELDSYRRIGIILEICQGTLHDLLKDRRLKKYEISRLMKQILTGLSYLHESRVVHRDIKPGNILIRRTAGSKLWRTVNTSNLVIKLSDFGLSRNFNPHASSLNTMTAVGTPSFAAPEIRRAIAENTASIPYNEKADIWPCGLIAYQMHEGKLPSLPGYDTKEIQYNGDLDVNNFKSFLLVQLEVDIAKRATVKALLEHPFISNFQADEQDIFTAIETEDYDYSRQLIMKFDINSVKHKATGLSPLTHASFLGNFDLVKVLVEQFHASTDDPYALLYAVKGFHRSQEVIEYLLARGCDPNARDQNGTTPLMWAVTEGGDAVARMLTSSPVIDVNARNNGNQTALMMAASGVTINSPISLSEVDTLDDKARLSLVKHLVVDCKADWTLTVNQRLPILDDSGLDALHFACYGGKLDCAKFLIEDVGMDPLAATSKNRNCLLMACLNPRADEMTFDVVKYLVEDLKMDVNAADDEQRTALHTASSQSPDLIRFLLKQPGIDVSLKDKYGVSAEALSNIRLKNDPFKWS